MGKVIIYNPVTKETKITQTKPGSPTYEKYISDGFQPICSVWGMNVGVGKLPTEYEPIKK